MTDDSKGQNLIVQIVEKQRIKIVDKKVGIMNVIMEEIDL